jgi:hypothetical protein
MDEKYLGKLGTGGAGTTYLKASHRVDGYDKGTIRLEAWKQVNNTKHEPRVGSYRAQDWQIVDLLVEYCFDHAIGLYSQIQKLEAIIASAKAAKAASAAEMEEFRQSIKGVRLTLRNIEAR